MNRDNCNDPKDAQDADSEGAQNHRDETVADTAQGTGEDLNRDVSRIERGEIAHHANSDLDNLLIGCEECVSVNSKEVHEGRDHDGGNDCHSHADAHSAVDAFMFVCTVILTDECRDCDSERVDDHPENRVDLSVGSPGGDGVCTERIDACLNDDV